MRSKTLAVGAALCMVLVGARAQDATKPVAPPAPDIDFGDEVINEYKLDLHGLESRVDELVERIRVGGPYRPGERGSTSRRSVPRFPSQEPPCRESSLNHG